MFVRPDFIQALSDDLQVCQNGEPERACAKVGSLSVSTYIQVMLTSRHQNGDHNRSDTANRLYPSRLPINP